MIAVREVDEESAREDERGLGACEAAGPRHQQQAGPRPRRNVGASRSGALGQQRPGSADHLRSGPHACRLGRAAGSQSGGPSELAWRIPHQELEVAPTPWWTLVQLLADRAPHRIYRGV